MKGVVTPGVKVRSHQVQSETVLPESEHTRLRGLAARANFLAADRQDIVYSAKEICRFMAKPTELATQALKRLGRYVKKHPRMWISFPLTKGELHRSLFGYALGRVCPNTQIHI